MINKKIDKITICADFGIDEIACDGASTKARNILEVFIKKFGSNNVKKNHFSSWKKHPFKNYKSLKKSFIDSKYIVLMPSPMRLIIVSLFAKKWVKKYNCKVLYSVVGGWLPTYIKKYSIVRTACSSFTAIFVETHGMEKALKEMGMINIYYSPVFSLRLPLDENVFRTKVDTMEKAISKNVFHFCTFSRVDYNKGILIAIDSIKCISSIYQNATIDLTIYGKISPSFENDFKLAIEANKKNVKYGGIIPDDKVISTLSDYFMLLFPTFFFGEGFPATLLESYMAGLPAIASNWKYNSELIDNGINGILFDPITVDGLNNAIENIINNKEKIILFKKNVYVFSKKFTPECALNVIFNFIDD
ncbi:MAG: glycosyltransferase [Clostridia bacterium]|nr:glycosyltransferase [Clostridia bacterium]